MALRAFVSGSCRTAVSGGRVINQTKNAIDRTISTTSAVAANRKVTLIPGDGIGPEISDAVVKIFEAAKVSFN